MTKSIFRDGLYPAILGLVLGIAMILSFAVPRTSVKANLPGPDWCPDTYGSSGPCTGGYCFTRGDGDKSCKYFQSGCNGGSCTSGP